MKTLTLIVTVVLFAVSINTFAEESSIGKSKKHRIRTRKVDTKYEERADKNNDGKVSRKENKATRKNYLDKHSEVNKKWEKRPIKMMMAQSTEKNFATPVKHRKKMFI